MSSYDSTLLTTYYGRTVKVIKFDFYWEKNYL